MYYYHIRQTKDDIPKYLSAVSFYTTNYKKKIYHDFDSFLMNE